MIIMALDHVRDAYSNAHMMGTELDRTWPALFFTRWITHFCAPVFVFLAGTGAYLQSARKSRGDLSRFLLTRGLWLLLVEVIWIHLAMTLDIGWHWTLLQVLWAIGWSMIALAGLVWLPTWAIGVIGVAIVAGHNLLPFPPRMPAPLPWKILEAGGPLRFGENHVVMFGYPLLAWIGVMASGYAFGALLQMKPLKPAMRQSMLALIGGGMIMLFVALRLVNRYGDPFPWETQKDATFTFMSFLNTTKYPPSLDFVLMTLGPAILILSLLDRVKVSPNNFVVVFGRVPFFYYVIHFPLISISAFLVYLSQYGKQIFTWHPPFGMPQEVGFSLPVVYAVWVVLVVSLYWPCRRFAEYKRAHPKNRWLSYL
jgi:uncharacterized membrane protein